MNEAQTIAVQVTAVEQVTPLIKHFTLAAADGSALPAFSGGSHIIVVMQGAPRVEGSPHVGGGPRTSGGTRTSGAPRVHRNP